MTKNSKHVWVKRQRCNQVARRFAQIPSVDSCRWSTADVEAFADVSLNLGSFLYGDHSISPLKVTRKMLVRLLSYYQIMPSYLEFLLVFGIHKHSREKRFSGFRGELPLTDGRNLAIHSLGRSGRQLQLCYNLKTVAKRIEPYQLAPSENHWTIRQGAFYHRFDVETGNSLWMITRAGLDIKQRVEDMTGKTGQIEDREFQTLKQCLRSSLAVHLLLCHWSSENWRTYLQSLEDTVENEVCKTLVSNTYCTDASEIDIWCSTRSSRPR